MGMGNSLISIKGLIRKNEASQLNERLHYWAAASVTTSTPKDSHLHECTYSDINTLMALEKDEV